MPPEIAALPPEIVIPAPVIISGFSHASSAAAPGQTIQLTANGTPIGDTTIEPDGTWSFTWIGDMIGPVEIAAVAVDYAGQVSAPNSVETELVVIDPHIDTPAPGAVLAPGTVAVQGTAQPGAAIQIVNTETNAVVAAGTVSAAGTWQVTVVVNTAGSVTLVAVAPGPGDTSLVSNPVVITIAPAVQPVTGGSPALDPENKGRTFTALVALLLAAGGFSTYFAGRLIYMLAKDRH